MNEIPNEILMQSSFHGNPLDIEHPLAKDIMTPTVYSISSDATLCDAIEMMYGKRISALVVTQDSENYIITNRDLITALHNRQNQLIDTKKILVREIMTGPIHLLDEGDPIDKVIDYMFVHGFKRVIIGKNGIPSGVVSNSDILMWTNLYFRPAKPLVFAIMENESAILIGNYVFKENVKSVNQDLLDMIGGALKSISVILEETLSQAGHLREVEKDTYVIIFEPREFCTGILFCDRKSINLRHKLHEITNLFCDQYRSKFDKLKMSKGIEVVNLKPFAEKFR